jgi:hypothetical protein
MPSKLQHWRLDSFRLNITPRQNTCLFNGFIYFGTKSTREHLAKLAYTVIYRHDGRYVYRQRRMTGIGQQSIGSGSPARFFQNLAMLLAVGNDTFAVAHKVDPVLAMLILGRLVVAATFLVLLHLTDNK